MLLALALLTSCNSAGEQESDTEAQTEESTTSLVRVIKVKKDLKKGTILSAKDIEIVDVEDSGIPDRYVKSSSEVINRKLLDPLKAGDIITTDHVSTKVYEEEKVELNLSMTEARVLGYVVVTDYVDADTGKDISAEIQKVIDDNPRKTIYFPDGEYVIANPIKTSSNKEKSVALHLAANAVIKASDNWAGRDSYMIQIGIIDKDFGMDGTGTNYYMYGGIIDGNGFANCVEISAGRELSLRNVTVKNAQCGLHIAYNEEYGSNDSDTEWINIEGNGAAGSVGVQVDGLDNTLTNVRVSGFQTGVRLTRPGNLMHNIHVINTPSESFEYENTKGFWDTSGGNWYDGCKADDYRTAFFLVGGALSFYNDCAARWTENRGTQYAIETDGRLSATFTSMRADFVAGTNNVFLKTYAQGGQGIIRNPIFNTALAPDTTYTRYLGGSKVVWSNE